MALLHVNFHPSSNPLALSKTSEKSQLPRVTEQHPFKGNYYQTSFVSADTTRYPPLTAASAFTPAGESALLNRSSNFY